ncbi:MAG: hypothetical protein JWO69_558, partial [Thermoleophilia bacterium]|nr:hypothetical protein [Thermoleophilia bacterium]
MLVTSIAPQAPTLAPVALALPALAQPTCCGKCGCGGTASARLGASPVDPLAALRQGVSQLG